MTATITLTGQLDELVKVLNRLAQEGTHVKLHCDPTPESKQTKAAEATKPQDTSAGGNTDEDMPADIVTIDRQMVRTEALIKSREGKKAMLKELLDEFGAASITALPEDKLEPFFNQLKNL